MREGSLTAEGEDRAMTQRRDEIQKEIYPIQIFLWVQMKPFSFMAWKDIPSISFQYIPLFCLSQFLLFLSLTTKRGSIKKLQFIIQAPSSRLNLDHTFWSLCLIVHRSPSPGPFHLLCPSFTPPRIYDLSTCARHPLIPLGSVCNLKKTFGCYPEETNSSTPYRHPVNRSSSKYLAWCSRLFVFFFCSIYLHRILQILHGME